MGGSANYLIHMHFITISTVVNLEGICALLTVSIFYRYTLSSTHQFFNFVYVAG